MTQVVLQPAGGPASRAHSEASIQPCQASLGIVYSIADSPLPVAPRQVLLMYPQCSATWQRRPARPFTERVLFSITNRVASPRGSRKMAASAGALERETPSEGKIGAMGVRPDLYALRTFSDTTARMFLL